MARRERAETKLVHFVLQRVGISAPAAGSAPSICFRPLAFLWRLARLAERVLLRRINVAGGELVKRLPNEEVDWPGDR